MTRSDETAGPAARGSGPAEHVRQAEQWIELGRRQLDEEIWTPDAAERDAAAELMAAAERPDRACTADPVLRRLRYLTQWVPFLVGGPGATGRGRLAAAPTVVGLADVLGAVRPVIAGSQHWHRHYLDSARLDPEAVVLLDEVDALLVAFTDILLRVAASAGPTRGTSTPAA